MSQLSEKITTETLRKIASNEEYSENEILCVAEYLANLYDYSFENQFGLINTDDIAANDALQKLKKLNLENESFFGVYTRAARHWVCFGVTHLHNSVVVLYKDSFGAQIPNELREALGECLKTEKMRFESHRGTEQSDESSSGPICLRNLQVLMKGFKSEVIKVALVDKFQKVRFCTQYGVQSVKREFRLWLQEYLLTGLEDASSELVSDPDYESFRESLLAFLESCTKVLKETYVLSSNYMSIVKTEAKKKNQDPKYEMDHKSTKAMKEAKDKFYRNSEVQKSLKFSENDFVDVDDGHKVFNLDIQEKYPEQMQKFTKIFAVLAQAEMNSELEKALRQVSQMLRLDYDKIRVYFEQAKIPRRPDFMRATEGFTPPSAVGILEKAVAAMKAKSKAIKEALKGDSVDKKIKTWDRLLSELILDVQHTDDQVEIESQMKAIRESLPKIRKYYAEWENRGVTEISDYANVRKAEEKFFTNNQIFEAVAVLDRANQLATGGLRLRDPQILSIIVFLMSMVSSHGKLCQIESGEGKTVIVSLLAVLMILQGEKTVDVITSNAVLAQEGVESRKLFYSMFNISVATNAADKNYASGPRKCYTADVVYGSISDFQFDYLRDTAEGLGTMCGRQFGRVILDEVDNMLVDNGRHIAKISTPFPGMENLKYIYLEIWNELLIVESELLDDFQEKLDGFKDLKKTKEMAVTEFIKIFDASMFGRMEERIKANLKEKLDLKFVPSHCLKYAQNMIPKWIGNAVRARYFMHENEQYSIKPTTENGEDAVVPVDYSNTGVTLKNTVWSYGLHQFVQIKHNLRITPESLTSSCVSNYAYIGKYGNKIFGLTGTLGSKAEQDLLSSIYNVEYARVPTYKTKVFKELKGVVVPDEEWSFEVTLMTVGLIRSSGRAVLIICKTIADLLMLEEQFECFKLYLPDCKIQVKKFQDEDTADVTHETVAPGDVIVATNIAGRGADFKTSKELEKNGGLHVLVGFCPDNERVREQAFFRTSRQGNFGTAQLVVRESEIKRLNIDTTNLEDIDFDEVKKRIDINEKERLFDIKMSKVDVLRYEDALFSLFSDLCQELKNNNVITWGHSYLMKDLKEYWAFWLEDQNFENKKYSLKEASFIFFKFKHDEKTKKIINGTISHNPYYGVLQADFFLKNEEVDKAKASLINAICLSKNAKVMYPAFLTLFDTIIEEKGPLMPRFRSFLSKIFAVARTGSDDKSSGFLTEILEYLSICHAGLSEEIDYMETAYFDDDHNFDFKRLLVPTKGRPNLLIKHLVAKLTCLKVHRSNVEILLESLEGPDVHNLAVGKRMADYLKNFVPDTKEEKQTKELMTEPELSELGSKGLKTFYGLKKIDTVCLPQMEKAKVQILGALSIIARAAAFPPLTFAVANVASLMVAEAIALVVLTMFKETNNIDDLVQKTEYLKGKSLNYIVSLVISGTLNLDVCVKIFLRMIRCYRESYYLLEHSTDNLRLLKSINSTQIAKDVKTVEEFAEYGTLTRPRKIRVPEVLASHFFDSDAANMAIGSLVDFVVEKEHHGLENGNGVDKNKKSKKNSNQSQFYNPAKESQSVQKMELYLTSLTPKKFGGSYEEIRDQFPKSDDFVTLNTFPSEIYSKDTPFASISRSRLPAIVILERDYQALQKLRCSSNEHTNEDKDKKGKVGSKMYVKKQSELLKNGEFWVVLKNEITEILAVSKFYESYLRDYANYSLPIIQMLQYCRDENIEGIPAFSANVTTGRLINQEQYDNIIKHFKLKAQ